MAGDPTEVGREPGHTTGDTARDLAAFGPLMRQQERIESEGASPTFASELRSRLVKREVGESEPGFTGNLRERFSSVKVTRPGRTGGAPRRSAPRDSRSPSPRLILVLAAALLVLIAELAQPTGLPNLVITSPYPNRQSLLYDYPSLPVVIKRLRPTTSLIHPSSGLSYAGHLRLTAGKISAQPAILPAYRLAKPPGINALRKRLHIRGAGRKVRSSGESWWVAVDGGGKHHRPMHSVSVAIKTGELIYHDRRNFKPAYTRRALPAFRTVRIARRWLSMLRLPASRMPVRSFGRVGGRPKVRRIAFGWPGVGRTVADEAILWVTPTGNVVEALVWPSVNKTGIVYAREVSAAWVDVQSGTAPLAVVGVSPRLFAQGNGALQRIDDVWVLSPGVGGVAYLVPAFRFAGTAKLAGKARPHHWFSLVPAAVS